MDKLPINHDNIKEFKDIPDGAHFRELGDKPRTFIKLRLTFASGDPFQVCRVRLTESDDLAIQDNFNAVDYQGFGGKCPPWVKFEVISTPL